MIRKIVLLLALTLVSGHIFSRNVSYDIIIVGGTPGGIMAAVSAARAGKTALILERSQRVGGLPANGLGATDIATRGATNGIFKEYVDRVRLAEDTQIETLPTSSEIPVSNKHQLQILGRRLPKFSPPKSG